MSGDLTWDARGRRVARSTPTARPQRTASAQWTAGAAVLLACLALPTLARADRVLVLRPRPAQTHEGEVSPELLARAEGAAIAALVSMGHEPVRDRGDRPAETPAEVRALATLRNVEWVLDSRVFPTHSGYVVEVEALHAASGVTRRQVQELVRAQEVAHMQALLTQALAPAPAPPPTVPTDPASPQEAPVIEPAEPAEPAEPIQPTEAAPPAEAVPPTEPLAEPDVATEEAAREAWAARELERAEAAEHEAWMRRERYGVPQRLMVQGGLAMRPLMRPPEPERSGVLGTVELRGGYGIDKAPGAEVRGSIEGYFGQLSGFALAVGGVYMWSPLVDTPVHFGAGLDVGYFQALGDYTSAMFLLRMSGVVSWRFVGQWFLESTLPEIMVLAGSDVAVTFGLTARIGFRFE